MEGCASQREKGVARGFVGGGGSAGAPCAVPALCEKWAILDPVSPMAKVTAEATVFPCAGLLDSYSVQELR